MWADIPHAVDANTGAFIPPPPSVIPPPPNATYIQDMMDDSPAIQGRAMNGTPYPHYAANLPSSAPTTPNWPSTAVPNYQPWGPPVTPIPPGSFGLPSPVSFGPPTPFGPPTSFSGYYPPSPLPHTPFSPAAVAAAPPYYNNVGPYYLASSPSLDSRGYPLARTPSIGRKRKSRSEGGSPQTRSEYQLWKGPDVYTSKNLAKRPRDWRPDYHPRSGLASYISLGRPSSDVPEFTDPVKRKLHALLVYRPDEEAIYWNMRVRPTANNAEFMKLNRPPNQIDWLQLATDPPADQMRLYHPKLPWYIDVFKRHQNGITIEDILQTIYSQLATQIRPRHYYNEELDPMHRTVLHTAYLNRCGNRKASLDKGILQVDFFADKYVLQGFVKGKNGMWEMKTDQEDT